MPTERGSMVLCDLIDLHGDSRVNLIEVIEVVTGDGIVRPDETRLLKAVIVLSEQTYRALPPRAAQNDDVIRLIGAAACAGRVTKHVLAVAREAAADVRSAA